MVMKKAKGEIKWVDDEVVGYKCICGEEITVGIYEDSNKPCPKCGRQYVLHQVNAVWEVEK